MHADIQRLQTVPCCLQRFVYLDAFERKAMLMARQGQLVEQFTHALARSQSPAQRLQPSPGLFQSLLRSLQFDKFSRPIRQNTL